MTTFQQKLNISIWSSLLFLIINLQQTYKISNNIFPWETTNNNCPTAWGTLTHTILFFIISYLSMGVGTSQTGVKLKNSLYGTLIFFFLSNPVFYKIMQGLFGNISNTLGCPTFYGILLSSGIYCLSLLGVMYLPN
jgi:hypothetical protein